MGEVRETMPASGYRALCRTAELRGAVDARVGVAPEQAVAWICRPSWDWPRQAQQLL